MKLFSFSELLVESNLYVVNLNIVPKKRNRVIGITDSTFLSMRYRKYDDLFLTPDMADIVIEKINEAPLSKKLDKQGILVQ